MSNPYNQSVMPPAEMPKTYSPGEIEPRVYEHWEAAGYFAPTGSAEAHYCIVIPPPNVTGTLHMG